MSETMVSKRNGTPTLRHCWECSAVIPENEGFYAFGHYEAVMDGGKRPMYWLTGLYPANGGPQRSTRKTDQAARFDLCAGCLVPFFESSFANVPAAAAENSSDFLAGCTDNERAYCVRLIRVLRENYWVAELARQFLDEEARRPCRITIKWFRNLLDSFDTIETLASNAQKLGANWSGHPILRAIRSGWGEDEIANYKSERAIRQLVESASKAQIRSLTNGR